MKSRGGVHVELLARRGPSAEAAAAVASHRMARSFAGVKIHGDQISGPGGSGPLAGARAKVESAGEIESRFTATRLVLMGPFALAFKKKKDKRELYLTVEGNGFAFVAPVPPKKHTEARQFAAHVTSLGMMTPAVPTVVQAAPQYQPAPQQPQRPSPPRQPQGRWAADPSGRFAKRWYDGKRWTEHVEDAAGQRLNDPPPSSVS